MSAIIENEEDNNNEEEEEDNKRRDEWQNKPPYLKQDNFTPSYYASCFCGAVTYELRGQQEDGTYCHCRGCQVLHGAPFQWASIYHKYNIRFTKGLDSLVFFNSGSLTNEHELPCKVLCKNCKTPIADEGRRMWLAFPTLIQNFHSLKESFRPSCHIFYGQRCIDINDGLPKYEGHKNKSNIINDPEQ